MFSEYSHKALKNFSSRSIVRHIFSEWYSFQYVSKGPKEAEQQRNLKMLQKDIWVCPSCIKVGDRNGIAWKGSTSTVSKSRQSTDSSFMQVYTNLEKMHVAHQRCRHADASVNSLAINKFLPTEHNEMNLVCVSMNS